jgi:hypothetical protein
VENYANIAYANYQKAYDDAVILKQAINTFTTHQLKSILIMLKANGSCRSYEHYRRPFVLLMDQ